mgnify:CR=1 FL=1
MKKLLIALLLAATVSLTACSAHVQTAIDYNSGDSMFVIAEKTERWFVVYHRSTKVMYAVSRGDSKGSFTLLVNADGSPMIYHGDSAGIPRVTP